MNNNYNPSNNNINNLSFLSNYNNGDKVKNTKIITYQKTSPETLKERLSLFFPDPNCDFSPIEPFNSNKKSENNSPLSNTFGYSDELDKINNGIPNFTNKLSLSQCLDLKIKAIFYNDSTSNITNNNISNSTNSNNNTIKEISPNKKSLLMLNNLSNNNNSFIKQSNAINSHPFFPLHSNPSFTKNKSTINDNLNFKNNIKEISPNEKSLLMSNNSSNNTNNNISFIKQRNVINSHPFFPLHSNPTFTKNKSTINDNLNFKNNIKEISPNEKSLLMSNNSSNNTNNNISFIKQSNAINSHPFSAFPHSYLPCKRNRSDINEDFNKKMVISNDITEDNNLDEEDSDDDIIILPKRNQKIISDGVLSAAIYLYSSTCDAVEEFNREKNITSSSPSTSSFGLTSKNLRARTNSIDSNLLIKPKNLKVVTPLTSDSSNITCINNKCIKCNNAIKKKPKKNPDSELKNKLKLTSSDRLDPSIFIINKNEDICLCPCHAEYSVSLVKNEIKLQLKIAKKLKKINAI